MTASGTEASLAPSGWAADERVARATLGRVRPAAVPLLLALALALAACGGDGEEAGETAAGSTTTPAFEEPDPLPRTEVEDGYLYEVSEEGFEVAVPRGWIARSAGQVPDPRTLRRLSTEYPTIIGYFETLVGDTPTRFVAVSPRLRDNFAENLTITVEDLPPQTTLQDYSERTLGQGEAQACPYWGGYGKDKDGKPCERCSGTGKIYPAAG